MDTSNDTPLKQCSKKENCVNSLGSWLPATTEYFYPRRDSADGLRGCCCVCTRYRANQRYKEHPEASRAATKRWTEANIDRVREYAHQYYLVHKSEYRERDRIWRETHPEEYRNIGIRWREKHRDREKIRHQLSYKLRRDEIKERRRRYLLIHPEKARIYKQARRARKRSLPSAFTVTNWRHCLDYFHYSCAVCGRQLRDLFGEHTAAADHWIPLNSPDCPGTIPTNIIPLCHGIGGCNSKKQDRDPVEFLETEFGKRKAKQILARIQAYFDSLK